MAADGRGGIPRRDVGRATLRGRGGLRGAAFVPRGCALHADGGGGDGAPAGGDGRAGLPRSGAGRRERLFVPGEGRAEPGRGNDAYAGTACRGTSRNGPQRPPADGGAL